MNFLQWLLPNRKTVTHIDKETLEELLDAAEYALPNEFLALLVGRKSTDLTLHKDISPDVYVITGFYVIPQTESDTSSATLKSTNVPVTETIVGSFHSHPNGVLKPSQKDSEMFHKYPVNLIAGPPFTVQSWACYDKQSNPRDLELIHVKDDLLNDAWQKELDSIDT